MATVYSRKLKDGVRWYTKVKQHDGTWKPVALKSARNEVQARRLAHEIEAEQERIHHGLSVGALFRGTFGELCEWAWRVHFSKLRGARSERSRLEFHGGARIRPDREPSPSWLGTLPAREVHAATLERYFAELEDKPTRQGERMSASCINRVRACFCGVFALAQRHGFWGSDNPAEATVTRKAPKRAHDILSLDEIARVLEATPPYWRGCFATGLLAGLRRGEIFGLRKSDVDLQRRVLLVQRSHGHDLTKGGDGTPELVPLHEDLVPFIVEWLDSPGEYLFPNHRGGRRSENQHVELRLRAAMARAGVVEHYDHKCRRRGCGHVEQHADAEPRRCPRCDMRLWPAGRPRKVRFHDTRHTMASHALMAGSSLPAVQGILRHKDVRTTMKHYAHLTRSHLVDEVNRLAIPGLAKLSQRGRPNENPGKPVEPMTLECTDAPDGDQSRGATVSPGLRRASSGLLTERSRGQKPAGHFVEPTGIEPVTCALRMPGPEALPPGTASQPVGRINPGNPDDSPAFPEFSPVFSGRGAGVSRAAALAHQTAPERKAQVSATAAPMLTVKQVAARLQVTPSCVYRQVELGALGHCRVANAIRVSEADLAAYIARSAVPGRRGSP